VPLGCPAGHGSCAVCSELIVIVVLINLGRCDACASARVEGRDRLLRISEHFQNVLCGSLREGGDKRSWQANEISEHRSWSMPSRPKSPLHVHHHQGEVDTQHDFHSAAPLDFCKAIEDIAEMAPMTSLTERTSSRCV